ncbi:hypothetical protein GOP47_0023501 [Adiantum capillus-veneris]|uniref:Protein DETOXIFICATION n=1 Tax=Adiantum capillus-veneris TaxID=13818 RepID=A0A9D4U3L1_ADICA|nr:hypothetical protein GOP47_0023501 [Adiantum capillus-veneris]
MVEELQGDGGCLAPSEQVLQNLSFCQTGPMTRILENASMCSTQELLKFQSRDVLNGAPPHLLLYRKTFKQKAQCSLHTLNYSVGEGYTARQEHASRRNLLVKCERRGDVLVADDGKGDPLVYHGREATHHPERTFWGSTFGREIWSLAMPAVMTQAIEPMAQLMETAYVGRLGSVELAAVGVSVQVFNLVAKIFNVPLLSTTTSFVAEDDALNEVIGEKIVSADRHPHDLGLPSEGKRRVIPAVSSALLLALILAVVESTVLLFGVRGILTMMGVSKGSPMRNPAITYLALRALGAPANVFALTVQGIFRGFKDTKTPLYAITISNICNIALSPILIFVCGFGVVGAAVATVASQYFLAFLLLWKLHKQVQLIPPTLSSLRLDRFLKSGGFLLGRTLAVLFTMTLATSMAARQGPMAMAGHQILYQIWLATSLLSDALALAGQALIANAYAKGDLKGVKRIAYGVLQTGLCFGLLLAIILSVSLGPISRLFTSDPAVLDVLFKGALFVAGTQPLNALAFVFDGLHYGVSDFKYAAYSMMVVGALSSLCLLTAPSFLGLPGVWLGLTLLMGFRAAAGWLRLSSPNGPWQFVRQA